MMQKILLTGAAGFIGNYVARQYIHQGWEVIGIDNLNDYYDVRLKEFRLSELKKLGNRFSFHRGDIEDRAFLEELFHIHSFDLVINLAARAGVRYSQENPYVYYSTNVLGMLNILELMRQFGVKNLITASTSSAYGKALPPFVEDMKCADPLSPYAASKLAMESLCYTYHHLYGMNCIVPRFFTVYGPCGRPDMSYFKFIKQISEDNEITLNGDGEQRRDFTYVEDIARGVWLAKDLRGFEIVNLGGDKSYSVNDLIQIIESSLGKKAKISYKPFHKADMMITSANISKARNSMSWEPQVPLRQGIELSIKWYKENEELLRHIELVQS